MAFVIHQGVIISLSQDNPRLCDLRNIPNNYLVKNARLPHILGNQLVPQVGSVVFYISEDSYRSYIISVVREPREYVTDGTAILSSSDDERYQLSPGEVYFESVGSDLVPGLGASLRLSNDGVIEMFSGKKKESITIGGEDNDEDGEIIITSDNYFVESNLEAFGDVRSTFKYTEDNDLKVGNDLVVQNPAGDGTVDTPICELTMDKLGNVQLRNAVLGADNSVLDMQISGATSLKNTLGELTINQLGAIDLKNNIGSLEISQAGSISITGPTIDLNNGTFGVARLNDTTFSSLVEDPAWWGFWSTIGPAIAALPTTVLDGGATFKAGLSALFATIPQTITSRINSASTTVTAGG